MQQKKLELLAPAGDWERLEMALAYGADAVYLAGNTFGMRSFAGNFSPEELRRAAKLCRERGVDLHVTCNTMPRNDEMARLPQWLELLEEAGVTAVILADEPTGALDSHTGREVLGMLQQMHDEGHTVVLITHDNSIAVQADRIIRLEDGRVVYDGDAHAPEAVVQPTLLPETPDEEEKA